MSKEFDKQYPRIPNRKALKPEDRAIVTKLVTASNAAIGLQGKNRELSLPDFSVLSRVAHRTASNITDARNMFQVLPDMDLARQILVSAILSPTDLTSSSLLYSVADSDLDSNLTGPMLREVKMYFETVYKINELLPQILDDALFMKGSYPILVLPEASIDHAINSSSRVSTESIKDIVDSTGWYRPLGLIGPSKRENGKNFATTFEAFGEPVKFDSAYPKEQFKTNISAPFEMNSKKATLESSYFVTDNPHVLKNPLLIDKMRKQRISDAYGVRFKRATMEAKKGDGGAEPKNKERTPLDQVQRTFYANRQYSQVPLQPILTPKQLDKENVGHPIVMHLPSEAVIPVHVPGNPRQHVGYFILLDVNGNPVSLAGRDDFYSDIRSSMAKNPDMASQLLNMTRRATFGREDWNTMEINEMARNYGQIVEQDLLNRLSNGLTQGEYELSSTDEIKRLMFSRAMSQKSTLMLFIPVELMTYITFDYNEFGIGKSLLEDGKILGSVRATLLFANTMAAVRNATGTQNINIELSPEDGDPYGTVEFMLNMYAKLNREGFPIGDTHPADLITHLQNAGKQVAVTGHPAFPEVKFAVEAREGSHKVIDTELEEMMRKRHIQMFGLTPETMEAASGANFATEVVNNFLMLLKRVVHYQREFKPFLEDFHRNYILNSSYLLDTLREIVSSNKKYLPKEYKGGEEKIDEFIHAFLMVLQVELPSPETNRLKEQMEAFQAYTDAITTAIDAYFSEEMLDSTAAQSLHESVPTTKAALIAHFRRKWLRDNGVLPELDIFGTMEEDDSPALNLLEEMDKYNEGLLRSVEDYMVKVHDAAVDRKKRLDKENGKFDAAMNGGDVAGGEGGDVPDDGGMGGGFDDDPDMGGGGESPEAADGAGDGFDEGGDLSGGDGTAGGGADGGIDDGTGGDSTGDLPDDSAGGDVPGDISEPETDEGVTDNAPEETGGDETPETPDDTTPEPETAEEPETPEPTDVPETPEETPETEENDTPVENEETPDAVEEPAPTEVPNTVDDTEQAAEQAKAEEKQAKEDEKMERERQKHEDETEKLKDRLEKEKDKRREEREKDKLQKEVDQHKQDAKDLKEEMKQPDDVTDEEEEEDTSNKDDDEDSKDKEKGDKDEEKDGKKDKEDSSKKEKDDKK